jgi:hypothetical protein
MAPIFHSLLLVIPQLKWRAIDLPTGSAGRKKQKPAAVNPVSETVAACEM